jgi:hypothetical protein
MNRPHPARSAVTTTPVLRILPRSEEASGLPGRLTRALPLVALAAIGGLALFLRLYHLDGLITLYPDSYAQLRATENLLALDFPISYHYPPGIALVMAPAFLVLPDGLVTVQAVILAAGLALVAIGYVWLLALTRDRRAASIFAAALAVASAFVLLSRVAWFDGVNTLLIVSTLVLAPHVAKRGTRALVAYGVLVFTMATVRHTNVVVLPALAVASMQGQAFSLQGLVAHLRSRPAVTVGLVVVALYVMHLAVAGESLGRFTSSNGGGILDLSSYPLRLAHYWQASLLGYHEGWSLPEAIGASAVVALATAGAQRLWQTRRRAMAAIGLLIAVWSPVHATYALFDDRYAVPVFFLMLMLASCGLSITVVWARALSQPWQRVGAAAVVALGVSMFVSLQLARDYADLQGWPSQVTQNRENAYDTIRAALRDIDGPATVISSQALAVDTANPEIEMFDLIPYSSEHGINEASVEELEAYVREQQEAGRTVYYHYTEYESVGATFRRYELGFDSYFGAIALDFRLTQLAYASQRPQHLYRIDPR